MFSWFKRGLPNLFSVIGIVLTFYFSVFYVPKYVSDTERARVSRTHLELVETIQEIVYAHKPMSRRDVETLIHGKELRSGVEYPYSVNDLLIQTQEAFMANRFVPLDERIALVAVLDSLREPEQAVVDRSEAMPDSSTIGPSDGSERSEFRVISILSILLGGAATALASLSLMQKLRHEREALAQEAVVARENEVVSSVREAMELERQVRRALLSFLDAKDIQPGTLAGTDYLVERGRERWAIEAAGRALHSRKLDLLLQKADVANATLVVVMGSRERRIDLAVERINARRRRQELAEVVVIPVRDSGQLASDLRRLVERTGVSRGSRG